MPSIKLISQDEKEETIVRSTSDFLIWLVGNKYPFPPKNFAEHDLLEKVLQRIQAIHGDECEFEEAWDAVVDVDAAIDDGDWEEPEDSKGWPPGEWGWDNKTGLIREPYQFYRDMPIEIFSDLVAKLSVKLKDFRLVGYHATSLESVSNLLWQGPQEEPIGTVNAKGKGIGFYVNPVVGPSTSSGKDGKGPSTGQVKKSSLLWGPCLVAVYAHKDIQIRLPKEAGVPEPKAEALLYYGADELVVPVNHFDEESLLLVRNPNDFSLSSNPNYKAVKYDNPTDAVSLFEKGPFIWPR
ncbi:hypothetical protein BTJ40_06895 [Microbulbifer sp. A4B17]|uniref:hypothetical protein n=1 Tax=Microbulbifer sp. A4B17 TaxID=359370 RepID=UPI000D52E893|nr:hypothetical protein [Microbulbifer sp. A4B17]AWF80558.1 hypothetical protein BTJ40_06895 [Microbulbifer sp. A4B17]